MCKHGLHHNYLPWVWLCSSQFSVTSALALRPCAGTHNGPHSLTTPMILIGRQTGGLSQSPTDTRCLSYTRSLTEWFQPQSKFGLPRTPSIKKSNACFMLCLINASSTAIVQWFQSQESYSWEMFHAMNKEESLSRFSNCWTNEKCFLPLIYVYNTNIPIKDFSVFNVYKNQGNANEVWSSKNVSCLDGMVFVGVQSLS